MKNNYAPRKPSLSYALVKPGPRVEWHGPSLWTADDLGSKKERPAQRRAREFLRTYLEAAPRLTRDINAAARKNRIARSTLDRAKGEMEIRHERICSKGVRMDFWLLPGQEVPAGLSDTPEADEALRQLGKRSDENPNPNDA
jgi:hypothetical protein